MERFRHHARGMTPYQIFVKFMQQTMEEIYQHLLERRIKYNCSEVDFGHSSRLYFLIPTELYQVIQGTICIFQKGPTKRLRKRYA